MSGGTTTQGAVYSPLPQTISDTDSSEEELNSATHQRDKHGINKTLAAGNKDTLDKRNGKL